MPAAGALTDTERAANAEWFMKLCALRADLDRVLAYSKYCNRLPHDVVTALRKSPDGEMTPNERANVEQVIAALQRKDLRSEAQES